VWSASWTYAFDRLGLHTVSANATNGGSWLNHSWSVLTLINFSGGVHKYDQPLMLPNPGGWEDGFIFDFNVWLENGTYHLYYAGDNIGNREIGYANSSDGFNWTKYSGNPILSPGSAGSWDDKEVFWTPGVEKINGTYWVYYNAFGYTDGPGSGLAKGTEPWDLTKFAGNPVIDDQYELVAYRINNSFWLGYNDYCRSDYVYSLDGENWTYGDNNPVVVASDAGAWASSCIYQQKIFVMNDTVYILYVGDNDKVGIGYCRMNDWENITLIEEYNPIIDDEDSGWQSGILGGNFIYNETHDMFDTWYTTWEAMGFGWVYDVTDRNGSPLVSKLFISPDDDESDVSTSLGSVMFNLTDAEGDSMDYTVETSPDIGNSSGSSVGIGEYSCLLVNLSYGTTYRWFVNVTDGNSWSNNTFTFTTEGTLPDDTLPPEISDVTITMSDPFDTDTSFGWENISCTVIDDVMVKTVLLNITYPDMHTETKTMVKQGNNYFCNTTLSEIGTYNYYIWANDSSNNINTSTPDVLTIPPNWDIFVDGVCNGLDVTWVSIYWMNTGDPGWIRADINNDGVVNGLDVTFISLHWMETWS